jgi:peptide-methionine (S)-S-oxide reductase
MISQYSRKRRRHYISCSAKRCTLQQHLTMKKIKHIIIMKSAWVAVLTVLAAVISCAQKNNQTASMSTTKQAISQQPSLSGPTDTATLGTGCFWCTEAIFEQLNGVLSVVSGYSGGQVDNPTYNEVGTGESGHAECVQIVFDPSKITFDELLEVFWQVHDPTTLNRQGADVGPQYRSVIFYHDDIQKQKAASYKAELNKSGAFDNPIVTTLEPFSKFYTAEEYHQEYYALNKNKNPYCSIVIRPKLEKFQKVFKDKLKKQ